MKNLQVIVHDNRRVLTTSQLAESYGTDMEYINRNFNNNKIRYKEGKHFFLLEGESLKKFKTTTGKNDVSLLRVNKLYLWTEKGAWLHAKSLNTDQAWNAYEMLVDEYYNIIERKSPSEIILLMAQQNLVLESRMSELENKQLTLDTTVNDLKDDMRVTSYQEHQITEKGSSKAIQFMGGKLSNAYRNKSLRGKVYAELWGTFKNYFQINKKGDLQKIKFDQAIEYIAIWEPSTALKLEIKSANSQMRFTDF